MKRGQLARHLSQRGNQEGVTISIKDELNAIDTRLAELEREKAALLAQALDFRLFNKAMERPRFVPSEQRSPL
ncbi:hypothetical protein GU3_01990 [Oceanimonas sp. GK1]|uniref:hypothetical protein n=1 Tax=Oceanimonas sp. (strain GK1 / IBRC-M 10197) TaxID=511062 RepID=UPI0002494A4B|nr:hypothetical protein [Oceanimonas sp. GK1]AEY00155.1 hypothetical protein GU3_01990 [Oceanimonas sp. GK1]